MKISGDIQDSLELKFSKLASSYNRQGKDIISLGLGEPYFPTPKPIIEEAINAIKAGYTRYSNPMGILELREAIVQKLFNENNVIANPNEIIITPGSKMALTLVLTAILEPGDEIINILPCYPSYIPQIKLAEPNCILKNIDLTEDFKIDFQKLKSSINAKTKVIILNSPHNPTGKMISNEELVEIEKITRSYDLFIISDEIYELLNFSKEKHFSTASIAGLSKKTITINGFSKAFSMTGWRIGYLVAPSKLIPTICKIQQHINTNVAPFTQRAALKALSISKDYLSKYNNQLLLNYKSLNKEIKSNQILSSSPSKGGLFSFINISKTGLSSDEFATSLLEESLVACTPGVNFGKKWDSYVRVSLAVPNEIFNKGISHLSYFAKIK